MGSHLLHVYTTEGQLRKLPSGLPHIEKIDSIVDRLTAKRVDDPVHYDLRDRATRLDLAYRYDRFLSLTNNRIEIEPNLQFAHIMVNYDLPWNPIRIDQRMGRLHRYGQEHTVEIRNLFFKDTRESEILSLLLEKTDQIEADLGMRSDVMGRVLEDVDLDETIMAAIANDTPTDEVVANIEATIEERKEALETVEEQFLIRDRFDLSDEDKEILDVIERSQHGEVSEDDIEILVREFFDAFEGDIKGVRPGPARSGGDVYQLDVPNVLSGDQVKQRYPMATFTRQVAIDHDDVDFIALDHPLVQSLIDFCLDSERVKGEIAVKTTEDDTAPASASRTAWDTSLELEMWLLRSSSACTLLRMERSPRRRPRSSIPYRPRKRVLSMDSTGWRRWLMTCISRRRWKPGTRSNRSLRRPAKSANARPTLNANTQNGTSRRRSAGGKNDSRRTKHVTSRVKRHVRTNREREAPTGYPSA